MRPGSSTFKPEPGVELPPLESKVLASTSLVLNPDTGVRNHQAGEITLEDSWLTQLFGLEKSNEELCTTGE
jgi:hypothetical protein